MSARILVVSVLVLAVLCTACPSPPPASLCGRRATAGGEIQDGKDCPAGYRCEFEPAPASSGDAEWGVCRRLTDSGPVVTDASTEGGVVDGARDGGVVDGAAVDAAGVDGGGADVAQGDSAVDPCTAATCAPNTTCADLHDGGFECRCGSSGVCSGDAGCSVDERADAGAGPVCCATGLTNCGGACVDTQVDEANCGGCGNACTGRDEGSLCVQGSCGCDPSADAGGVCPVNTASAHPAAMSCESVDGGSLGRCTYTCAGPWKHCTGSDPKECETNTDTDDQHCGSCTSKARQTVTVNSVEVVVSNRCVGGVKVCGRESSVCLATGQAINKGCYEPGGAGDVNASCEACWDSAAPLCGTGSFCCQGACVTMSEGALNQRCGCDPTPGVTGSATDCPAFDLATATGPGGKVCVDGAGDAVTRLTLASGTCGCNMSGAAQCGAATVDSAGLGTGTFLAGLCDGQTNRCVEQGVTSCGMVGGVVTAAGTQVPGATCNPLHGGQVCEDNLDNDDGMGECGCGTWDVTGGIDKSTSCTQPVQGPTRQHVVADTCASSPDNYCHCSRAGNFTPCDPTSAFPDCCGGTTGGCVDLAANSENCGVCGTKCGATGLLDCGDGALADGQCACSGTSGEECPTTGGGGGRDCVVGGKCVCSQNSNLPCPVGTWCCAGDHTTGQAEGCCENPCASATNSCMRPVGCLGNTTSKTCTSGSDDWCCLATQRCGTTADSCL